MVSMNTKRFKKDACDLFRIWLNRIKRRKAYHISFFQYGSGGEEVFVAESDKGVGCYFMFIRDAGCRIKSRKGNIFFPDAIISTHISSLLSGHGE